MPLTKEQCQQFHQEPTRNPVTGRKIKVGAATYNKLVKECIPSTRYRGKDRVKTLLEVLKNLTKAYPGQFAYAIDLRSKKDTIAFQLVTNNKGYSQAHIRVQDQDHYGNNVYDKKSITVNNMKSLCKEVLAEFEIGEELRFGEEGITAGSFGQALQFDDNDKQAVKVTLVQKIAPRGNKEQVLPYESAVPQSMRTRFEQMFIYNTKTPEFGAIFSDDDYDDVYP